MPLYNCLQIIIITLSFSIVFSVLVTEEFCPKEKILDYCLILLIIRGLTYLILLGMGIWHHDIFLSTLSSYEIITSFFLILILT